MGKKSATIITLTVLLLALATPCVWLGLVNRQKRLDKALFEAAEHGTGEDVRKAVEVGGRVNAREEDLEPLHLPTSSLKNMAFISDLLLDIGISTDSAEDASWLRPVAGVQAIHRAAQTGNTQAVQSLLDAGADVNAADDRGWQAIHYAVRGARDQLGPGWNAGDAWGTDDGPALQREKEMASLLLKAGAKTSRLEAEKRTEADEIAHLKAQGISTVELEDEEVDAPRNSAKEPPATPANEP